MKPYLLAKFQEILSLICILSDQVIVTNKLLGYRRFIKFIAAGLGNDLPDRIRFAPLGMDPWRFKNRTQGHPTETKKAKEGSNSLGSNILQSISVSIGDVLAG